MRQGRPSRWALAWVAAASLSCAALSQADPVAAAERRVQSRPELSGWWQAAPPFAVLTFALSPPPFKPAAAAQYQPAAQAILAGRTPEYCRPYKFTGFSYGIASDMEILLTPGRVTLISSEVGLVRRIYIGAATPSHPLPTDSGTSIGHWEGDTLVVRTIALDPAAPFPTPLPGAPSIGAHAEVAERIHLQDRDTLVLDIETTAPEILTAPDRRRQVYRRVEKQIDYAMTICSATDRTVDAAGRQQFDMTPPKDLPPPPP